MSEPKEMFSHKMAATLLRDRNSLSDDELTEFVIANTNLFYEWKKQVSEIGELKRKLAIAEQEISFLQVTK